ncbi:MAG: DNA polymerase I, partial [bacterium]|nr:DNA polymerase I [bacterium]
MAGKFFDTMIAAHVLDSTRMTYKMDALAADLINHRCIPITEIIGRGKSRVTIDTVPTDMVAVYAAEDADVTLRLADVLVEKLSAQQGLSELLSDLEMPLLPVLVAMETKGITLDPQALKRMEIDLSKQVDQLRDQIIELAGRQFNPDSPKQLAVVLFEDLALPVIKKVKTGPSTDSGVLEELASQHELPGVVLEYRKLTKLLSTYVKSLVTSINSRTGRVHTSFHQAGTATGRLSSSDPNLQNIPIRTPQGRKIREAFIAPEGKVLLSADYSQIELRMLAHLCGDQKLCEAFANDQDIHRMVAAEVFGVPVAEVTPTQRSRAKTVNFGIIYGQTAHGLSRTLHISRTEAADYIRQYRNRFPDIDKFLKSCIAHAEEHGYVETILARRRNIPEIGSRNPQRRAFAERLAMNSVVQGSAADLIKRAMINISNRITAESRPCDMLLQIHDELVFETPEEQVESDREMIVTEMCQAV